LMFSTLNACSVAGQPRRRISLRSCATGSHLLKVVRMERVQGLLLAAGAGRRMGMPKALKTDPDGTPWLRRAVEVLRAGGCGDVTVVLGACEGRSAPFAPDAHHVICPDWSEGIG